MATSTVSHETTKPFSADIEKHRDVLVPPSAEQIDGYIAQYEYAKGVADEAKEAVDIEKDKLVFLADNFGHRPPHAEQSVKLQGLRNSVTVTRGTSVTVNESAVLDFQIATVKIPGLFARIFATSTKSTLIKGASDVLKALALPRRQHESILAMFGKCIDVKTNAPSVKVEIIKPEKPAKARKTAKAAAAIAFVAIALAGSAFGQLLHRPDGVTCMDSGAYMCDSGIDGCRSDMADRYCKAIAGIRTDESTIHLRRHKRPRRKAVATSAGWEPSQYPVKIHPLPLQTEHLVITVYAPLSQDAASNPPEFDRRNRRMAIAFILCALSFAFASGWFSCRASESRNREMRESGGE